MEQIDIDNQDQNERKPEVSGNENDSCSGKGTGKKEHLDRLDHIVSRNFKVNLKPP